jgi:hypothetical protein
MSAAPIEERAKKLDAAKASIRQTRALIQKRIDRAEGDLSRLYHVRDRLALLEHQAIVMKARIRLR